MKPKWSKMKHRSKSVLLYFKNMIMLVKIHKIENREITFTKKEKWCANNFNYINIFLNKGNIYILKSIRLIIVLYFCFQAFSLWSRQWLYQNCSLNIHFQRLYTQIFQSAFMRSWRSWSKNDFINFTFENFFNVNKRYTQRENLINKECVWFK